MPLDGIDGFEEGAAMQRAFTSTVQLPISILIWYQAQNILLITLELQEMNHLCTANRPPPSDTGSTDTGLSDTAEDTALNQVPNRVMNCYWYSSVCVYIIYGDDD